MRNQKGITLVALVITIIVLLILAGVSISLVLGQNGVLTQASNAVITNAKATALQELQMAVSDAEMAYYSALSTSTNSTAVHKYSTFTLKRFQASCTNGTVTFESGTTESGDTMTPSSDSATVLIKYVPKSDTSTAFYYNLKMSDLSVAETTAPAAP